jgi:hypothetical protein
MGLERCGGGCLLLPVLFDELRRGCCVVPAVPFAFDAEIDNSEHDEGNGEHWNLATTSS